FESRHLLKDVVSLKAYLFKSVQNSCLNYLKMNKIHREHQEKIYLASSGIDEDISKKMQESELRDQIFQIVSRLPDRCRQVFRMSRVDGLKNDEIARKCNISKRTVETQISKALKILRQDLAPYLKVLIINILFFLK
ncbi:sigma-70 family RNA polymerase sigma factor, partial [Bacteroidota bacterium]